MIIVLFIVAVFSALLAGSLVRTAYQAQAARSNFATTITATNTTSALQVTEQLLSSSVHDALVQVINNQSNSSNTLYLSGLASVASSLQNAVDNIQCSLDPSLGSDTRIQSKIRIYFTQQACGEVLPTQFDLGSPRLMRGANNTGSQPIQEYTFPFIALVTSETSEGYKNQAYLQGEYRFEIGTAPYSRWNYFLLSTYRPDGRPGYLTSQNIFTGPVHFDGVPFIWGRPWFGAPSSASGCDLVDVAGCNGTLTRTVGLGSEGILSVTHLSPSPIAPCYPGGDCPTFAEGIDWHATYIGLFPSTSNTTKTQAEQPITYAQAATGVVFAKDLSRLTLHVGNSPRTTGKSQLIDVTPAGESTRSLFIENADPTTLWLQSTSGQNIVLNNTFAAGTNGWVGIDHVTQPVGAPTTNVGVQYARDAYYGDWFPVSPGSQFDLSVSGASAAATSYRLQVGMIFELSDGSHVWLGTADGQTNPQSVAGDGTWQTVSGTITAPSNARYGRVWVQNSHPHNTTNPVPFYVTNVYVAPKGFTAYSVPASPFTGIIYSTGNINQLSAASNYEPAIADFEQLTIAADGDIRVTTNLRYESPPCETMGQRLGDEVQIPKCTNTTPNNLLGIYTQNGNIVIASGAGTSGTVEIHGALMARGGTLVAEDFDNTNYLPNYVDVLGSLAAINAPMVGIKNNAGTRTSGFLDLRLVYDPRFADQIAPPGWPRIPWKGVLNARYILTGRGTGIQ